MIDIKTLEGITKDVLKGLREERNLETEKVTYLDGQISMLEWVLKEINNH